jgi:hypothetical protein
MSQNRELGTEAASGEAPKQAALEWTVLPFKESARRSVVVVGVIIGVGLMVILLFKDLFLGALSVLVLFASLHTYFGRTTYRLEADRVTVRSSLGTTMKPWSHFKRFYVDRRGVTLSPFAKPSRLEPFRSVRLLYGSNKDEVVAFISKRLDRNPGSGTR